MRLKRGVEGVRNFFEAGHSDILRSHDNRYAPYPYCAIENLV